MYRRWLRMLKKWDKASEIRRVNPLKWRYPDSRRKLLAARDAAYGDTRQKSFFVSYFMNLPDARRGAGIAHIG